MNTDYDAKPFIITMLLIISFFFAFLIIMGIRPDLLNDIAAIWRGWIGAAIGYFFGSRPTETMLHSLIELNDQRRKELEDEKNQSITHTNEMYKRILDCGMDLEQARSDIQSLDDQYKKAIEDIRNIVTNYGKDIPDKELINHLTHKYIDN